MTDTTETPQPPVPPADNPRRRFFRRAAIATVIVTLATGVGLKAFAHGHGFGGWHRGGFMGAQLDPAKLDEHLEPSVDRAALEALRADQLQMAEQASRRFTQALADAADVLTPEQRKQLAERAGRWHGRRG